MANYKKTTVSLDNRTRTISVSNDKIIYTYKNDNISEYLTYNDTLYHVLMHDCLKLNRGTKERLALSVWKDDDHENQRFKIYDLALACYMGWVGVDTYLEDMRRFMLYKRENRFDIDHADSNVHNNTMHNLSLMDETLNKQKCEITTWFKPPFALNSAYRNGEYRVQFEAIVNQYDAAIFLAKFGIKANTLTDIGAIMRFICKDAHEYVRCLKWLFDCSYEFMSDVGTPRQQWQKDKKQVSLISDKIQEELVSMDRECFQEFSEIKTPC